MIDDLCFTKIPKCKKLGVRTIVQRYLCFGSTDVTEGGNKVTASNWASGRDVVH